MSTELATAYVSLTPSFQGGAAAIGRQVNPAASKAGNAAGGALGGGMLSGLLKTGTLLKGGAVAVGGMIALGLGKSMQEVESIIVRGTGASGSALDGLMDDFGRVARKVPQDMATVGGSISSLNTLTGATGEVLQDLSKNVLDASRMLGEDGASNAEKFGRTLQQWQVPADQGVGVLDQLFAGTQKYGIGLGETVGQLNEYGSVLQNAGFSMGEAAVLFGSLNAAGLKVSRLMPGLNLAFRNWAKEGKNVQDELGKTVDKIANAEDGTKALAIATDAFGAQGAQRLVTAIRSGAFSLDDLSTALGDTDGAIASTEKSTRTLGESWAIFKNMLAVTLAGPLGKVVDVLTKAMSWITDVAIPALSDGGAAAGVFGDAFRAIGDALAPLLPVVKDLAKQIADIVVPAFSRIGDLIANNVAPAFARFLEAAQPVLTWLVEFLGGAVVGAISGAVQFIEGALQMLSGIFDVFAGIFSGDWSRVWDGIRAVAEGVWNMIVGAFKVFINLGILRIVRLGLGLVRNLWSAGWNAVRNLFSAAWSRLTGAVSSGISGLVGWFRALPGRILSALASLGSRLLNLGRTALTRMRSGVSSGFSNVLGFVRSIPGRIIAALGNVARLLWNAGGAIMRGLRDGIVNGLKSVTSFVSGIGSTIASLKGPRNYDLALLRPAGNWIMTGLQDGIEDQMPSLRSMLTDVAAVIQGAPIEAPDIPAAAGRMLADLQARQTVDVNVHGADSDFVRLIRKWFRTKNL